MAIKLVLTLAGLSLAFIPLIADENPVAAPAWRDKTAGTAYLGPDVLWRTRESVVFHLQDEVGTGFTMDVTVRDMNIYMQGARPVLMWVVGPDGKTLVREIMEDDGVVSGNEQYRDGLSDIYLDHRYREWHRTHSPNGYPPGKQRSPFLAHPEKILPRQAHLTVAAAGKGLYRVVFIASWDHWISLTPDRPIATGIHPGPGPLYVHGDRLKEAYFYAPANVKDIGVSITEEIQPFSWKIALEDEAGQTLGQTTPRTFMSFLSHKNAKSGIFRLRVTGNAPGACLHMGGVPAVLCPDAETAKKIHGGSEFDAKGRIIFHPWQRTLYAWADSLKPEDLKVEVPALPAGKQLPPEVAKVPAVLDNQIVDPADPNFGDFRKGGEEWKQDVDVLAKAAGWKHPDNIYYGNQAMVRRVLLRRVVRDIGMQGPYFWYEYDAPRTFEYKEDDFPFCQAYRSAWYFMGGGYNIRSFKLLREVLGFMPAETLAAFKQSHLAWLIAHTLAHQGECCNQWACIIASMADLWDATNDPLVGAILKSQIERFITPGSLGRTDPDPTPYCTKSARAYTYDVDIGTTGAGYPADGLGHDNEYCLESEIYVGRVWESLRDQRIIDWFNKYYYLKTHLTLPRWGVHPQDTFNGTCSPSDSNFRTCCYTHKSPIPGEARPLIKYGALWTGQESPDTTWPCLEQQSFTRVIDNKFFFINTPGYYCILYGGPSSMNAMSFVKAIMQDGSGQLVGYGGMDYGGFQYNAAKPGGLSAVFVKNCGPTILGQNIDVMYSNVIWGRRKTPVCPKWAEGQVDPFIICSGYAHPYVVFDEKGRLYQKTESVPYAPLLVTRTIHMQDDCIAVTLELVATDNLDLAELYEAIPYFADRRNLRTFPTNLAEGTEFKVPETILSRQRVPDDQKSYWQKAFDLPPVTFRAIDIAAKSGAGSTVIFDQEYTFKQNRPLRYREEAAAVGSFNLPLPAKMQAGERRVIRYVIYSHANPVTAADIRRIITQERL